jgi:hypothetical protein
MRDHPRSKFPDIRLRNLGSVVPPDDLQDAARQAWSRYIEPCVWLDASREPLAVAFCRLWQEFTDDPNASSAARHGQLRLYLQELGLSDERARTAAEGNREETEEERKWRKFEENDTTRKQY